MYSIIKKFCNQCLRCRQVKSPKYTKMPMIIPTTPQGPWDVLSIDIFGPIISSVEGFNNIFVMSDIFSGFTVLVLMRDPTAELIAEAIVHELILTYGRVPRVILSDNAQYFNSKIIKFVCKLLRVKHKNIVPRAPWMNSCERKNPFLSYYLKFCLLDGIKMEEWPKWLKYVSYSINSCYNRSTGYSPLELNLGRNLIL